MNEIQSMDIKRTPHIIATEIYAIKGQARNVILLSSVEIGKRLVEAKEMLSHGEWGEWLEKSVEYSQRTAQRLMQIYKEFNSEDNKSVSMLADLSYTKAIALLGIPSEEREEFIKNNPVEEMSTRELQKAIKEKQELEKKLKAAEEKVEKSTSKLSKVEAEKNKIKEKLDSIEEKNKEELVNKEVEIENLKLFVSDIEKKLAEAKVSGNEEEVEKLQLSLSEKENTLFEANNKIKELEEQLKEKPVDVKETIVEKIPEEIEKELQELREKVSQASSGNEPTIKFSIYFQELVKGFKELLETLSEIDDVETHTKYKNAVSGLINKMLGTL